jgi:hypothetical protein
MATFSEATFGRAVALGGEGFGLALLVALVFIFDQPFKGRTSVSPNPIVKVVAEMQARTFLISASRKRAWKILQEIRWVLKDTTGIEGSTAGQKNNRP